MFRGCLDNFLKGFCLLWNSENSSYSAFKTFRDIFWTNINIFSITVIANNMRLVLPNHPFCDILYYIFILRVFINGIISNTFMNMTLGRIVLNTFREKNLSLNIQENNTFNELIFKEAKIVFYSKLYYIGELIIISLLSSHKIYYYLFSVYFYGKYMTEIYLNLRDISSRIHNRYLSRLIFYRLGIGSAVVILLWIFEITIGTYGPDFLTKIIFNDCIFNIIYGYYVNSFEDIRQAPRLEDYEPFFFPIRSDYLFRGILFVFSNVILNIEISPIIKKFCLEFFNYFTLIFIDYRIKEDPLSYPPILHCIEVYQQEILLILNNLLLYNKVGTYINDKIILFLLSIWAPKNIIKLAISLFNNIDYEYVNSLCERIKILEVDFFILAEEKREDNFTLIQQAISYEGETHFYLSESKSLTHKEIISIRANPSPTINISPAIPIEIIDNHFK